MKPLFVVILAAGLGRRMKSDLPKVLFRINGVPLVEYVLRSVKQLSPDEIVVVVGYKAPLVIQALEGFDVRFSYQKNQLGTAHALRCAFPYLPQTEANLLVVCGDTPFISSRTLRSMLERHIQTRADLTILTSFIDNPTGYGRIVRDSQGRIFGIVEEKDATEEQKAIKEFNSGTYIFDFKKVLSTIDFIGSDNAQREFYLTDTVRLFLERGWKVESYIVEDNFEVMGINSLEELRAAEREYLRRQYDKA